LAAVLGSAQGAWAQNRQSPELVGNLAALMTAHHLETVAAQDPEAAGRFVAALFVPDVQLLIVSAQYPAPAELQALLTQRNYRDVYTALHQPSTQKTRFFLMDVGCDGLRSGGDGVDVLYEHGSTQTLFDGRWKPQGLSEGDYVKRAQNAEERYARLLSILTATFENTPGTAAKSPESASVRPR
jgi:hypothetical protein